MYNTSKESSIILNLFLKHFLRTSEIPKHKKNVDISIIGGVLIVLKS